MPWRLELCPDPAAGELTALLNGSNPLLLELFPGPYQSRLIFAPDLKAFLVHGQGSSMGLKPL